MLAHHGFEPLGGGWIGWLLPLFLLGLLIAIGAVLFYSFRRRPETVTDGDPLRRAARRYASGEIERVEFERIQRDLSGSAAGSVQTAAMRLAKGEISVSEFDELRSRLDMTEGDESPESEEPPAE